jgi:cyclic pyranopterin phosphate synthase
MGIRVVTTTNCQLNCTFCHKEGWNSECCHKDCEITTTVEACRSLRSAHGNDVTLSGGEPLLHQRFEMLAEHLLDNGFLITVVTNGHLLNKYVEILKQFRSVHVSLPTLNFREYEKLTGTPIEPVIDGIKTFLQKGFRGSLKINAVCGVDYPEYNSGVFELIEFVTSINGTLKFIRQFDPDTKKSMDIEHLLTAITSLGYEQFGTDGRTDLYQRKNSCLIEVAEVTCARAQRESDPCAACWRWRDAYVGVSGQIFYCAWSSKEKTRPLLAKDTSMT